MMKIANFCDNYSLLRDLFFTSKMRRNVQETSLFEVGGYSLIELLLVVTLIIILGASTTPFLSNFIQRSAMETTKFRFVSFLRKAQANTMDGKLGSNWGVCLSSGVLRLYAGSCVSPTQSFTHEIPNTISVSGFSDLEFSSIRGEPSTTATVTFSSDIDTQTVTINSVGMVDP